MFKFKAGTEYEERTDNLFSINRVLWKMITLETIVIVALVIGYLNLKETVQVSVELPSKIYLSDGVKIKRGIDWANKDFFRLWGRGLAEDISNFTPDNIPNKMALVVKMMRPTVAVKMDDVISKYTKAIINNRIKQEYQILSEKVIDISKSEKQMIYTGVAKQQVGAKKLKPKECKYSLKLKIFKNGVVYVEDIGTDCL